MAVSPVRIGSIDLTSFEVPPSVQCGGQQRLIVHKLASGRRVVERLGPDEADIRFSGIFSGQDAEARARQLNGLRISGDVVWMTWASFRYSVVVKSIAFDFQQPWWIPYKAVCLIVQQPGSRPAPNNSQAQLISGDLEQAIAAASETNISLAAIQATLGAANALTVGTAGQSEALQTVSQTLAALDSTIGGAESQLLSGNTAGAVRTAYPSQFMAAVGASATLAAAANTRAYVRRIGRRLESQGM